MVNLLGGYGYGYVGSEDGNEGKRLVEALKELISTFEKVWEGMMRGVVLKCGEEVAVKIIKGNREERGNFAAYTALQYLALHAVSRRRNLSDSSRWHICEGYVHDVFAGHNLRESVAVSFSRKQIGDSKPTAGDLHRVEEIENETRDEEGDGWSGW